MLDWNTAQNILCIRLDTVGDIVMTTPAIRALKVAHPHRRITLMTSAPGAAVVPLIPEIDEVIVYDAPWLKATALREDSHPEFTMVERLRQGQFDAAVIFTVYSQNPLPSAFLCYLADIPLRLAHCHENPYQLLTHWVKDPEPEQLIRHEVRRQLDLVASVGGSIEDDRMRLAVPEQSVRRVQQLLQAQGVKLDQRWVVIHPGATAPSRRYPPEQFAAVAYLLIQQGIQVVFTGTQTEQELVATIQSLISAPTVSLVNQLTLSDLTALLTLAPLLISNNTGPVHIAAAVNTPVVDLYALTNPQHTPWGVANRVLFHDVSCRFCYKSICPEKHHHCLRLVDPIHVMEAAIELLTQTEPVPTSTPGLVISNH